MEEKTRVIVVMRSRYTLCIKDAVMANFRIVLLDLWRKIKDAVMAREYWRDRGNLMHKGCSNGRIVVLDWRKRLW